MALSMDDRVLDRFGGGTLCKLPWTRVGLHISSAVPVSREALARYTVIYTHKEPPGHAMVLELGKNMYHTESIYHVMTKSMTVFQCPCVFAKTKAVRRPLSPKKRLKIWDIAHTVVQEMTNREQRRLLED